MVKQDEFNKCFLEPLLFTANADPSGASQEDLVQLGQSQIQMPAEEEHLQDPLPG